MDLLAKGYSALKGERGTPQSPEQTIEKLCERAASAPLLEDRRAAVLSLKGLARDLKVQVGSRGLGALAGALTQDQTDSETVHAALETLAMLCSVDGDAEADPGVAFCEIFLKDDGHVQAVVEIAERLDFYSRLAAVGLLRVLAASRPERVQACVLACGSGPAVLIGLLEEDEVLRNEALLLLAVLARGNAEMQQILVFQEAFERLLAIIYDEFAAEGGVVIEDCLRLFHVLLRHNVLNQNHFRESGMIPRLRELFVVQALDVGTGETLKMALWDRKYVWSEQSVRNAVLIVATFRLLVAPKSPSTRSNQQALAAAGFLPFLLELGCRAHVPAPVQTACLYAAGDLIRHHSGNQDGFLGYTLEPLADGDSSPVGEPGPELVNDVLARPTPALLLAAQIALRPARSRRAAPLETRAAAAYLVQSALAGNADAQFAVATTLRSPPVANANDDAVDAADSVGMLLATVLVDWEAAARSDPMRLLLASAILTHVLYRNSQTKQLCLELHYGDAAPAESLLDLCARALAHATSRAIVDDGTGAGGVDVRVAIAFFGILTLWLDECPPAVAAFLREHAHAQLLIEKCSRSVGGGSSAIVVQGLAAHLLCVCIEYNDDSELAFTRASLADICTRRIGADVVLSALERLRDSPEFRRNPPVLGTAAAAGDEADAAASARNDLFFDPLFQQVLVSTKDTVTVALVPGGSLAPQRSDTGAASARRGQSPAARAQAPADAETLASYRELVQKQDGEIAALRVRFHDLELELAAERSAPAAPAAFTESDATRLAEAEARVRQLEAEVKAQAQRYAVLAQENEDALACLFDEECKKKAYKQRLRALGQPVNDESDDDDASQASPDGNMPYRGGEV